MNASVENACRLLLSSASTVRRLLTACGTYCFFSSGLEACRALSRRICARLLRASTVWSGSTSIALLKSDSALPRSPFFQAT